MEDFKNFNIKWSEEKDIFLINERNISFEKIAFSINNKMILKVKNNPNPNFAHQKCFVLNIDNYAYIVPFVIDLKKKEIFLKTAYPSRKATKLYNLR